MTDLHDADSADSAAAGLWASDALLDALGAGAAVEDDRTAALLAALVADVSAEPLPALPQVPRRRRGHRLAPRTGVAAAAVVAMLSTGGVAAASVNAGPTSALFPLHQVLTGRPQLDGSQRQAMEIKDKLKSATKALASGKVARAQKDVASAADRLPKVAARDGHSALAAEWTAISKQVKAEASATPTAAVKPVTTLSPTPTHTVSPPGRSTSAAPTTTTHAPTVSPAPVTSVTGAPATTTNPPAAGVGPTTGLTTPAPTGTGSVTPTPSVVPSTTPSPSDSAGTGSPTSTPTGTQSHKPGKGSGGSVAPGSPPAPSTEPPSPVQPPVTVPAASEAPVTVPPASIAAVTVPAVLPSAVAPTPSDG
jgi:hypothetical protein